MMGGVRPVSAAKILIVEDEGIEALDTQQRLTRLGYSVPDIAFTGEEAVRLAESISPDLVLMDIMLRGQMGGIEAAQEIRTRFGIPVVYVTAYSDEDTLARAKIAEPHGYIVKPYDERELRVAIEVALYRHEMERKLRESEERYRAISEQLEDSNRRKNQFLAILSHELRNPLASIHNCLSILDQIDPSSEQGKRAFTIMRRQAAQLSRLVNDLLDINRIEQDKIHLQMKRLDLVELLRQVLEDHRTLMDTKGVSLSCDLPPYPVYLEGDENRLTQVIGNLLHNAAKFVDSGGTTHIRLEALHTQPEDKRRATAAGFHRHVAKPVDLEELDQILAEADVEKRETGASPLPAGQLALK